MFIDFLNPENTVSYNIKVAHVFGLHTAIYCSVLSSIKAKAIEKNKIDEGFFRIDRKYISSITMLTEDDQLKCEANLVKIGVVYKKQDADKDIVKFDEKRYVSIIASEDVGLEDDLRKKLKVKSPFTTKEAKLYGVIHRLQDAITCSDYQLLTALRNWVEAVCVNKGLITKTVVDSFMKTLIDYTKGDVETALRLVEIATNQCYRDCHWAINSYERELDMKKQQNKNAISKVLRVTDQKKVDKSKLSNIIY